MDDGRAHGYGADPHQRDVDGIVMGPGRSEQSHAADEWVETEQLESGVRKYVETIERYFS